MKSLFKSLVLANATLAVLSTSSALAQQGRATQTIISDVEAAPANGGINPDFSAVEVSGQIILGSNACLAQGNTAELVQRRRGRDILVIPVLRTAPDDGRVCTMIYDPVYVTVSTTVRANSNSVNGVLVANVDEKGNTVRVHSFR